MKSFTCSGCGKEATTPSTWHMLYRFKGQTRRQDYCSSCADAAEDWYADAQCERYDTATEDDNAEVQP
jgi:hypothetical protein